MEENDFLHNTYGNPNTYGITRFWIGGRQEKSEWTWSDGTNWNFHQESLWFTNQPSGDGDCLEILDYDRSQGTWNDLSCIHPIPFVWQISSGKP